MRLWCILSSANPKLSGDHLQSKRQRNRTCSLSRLGCAFPICSEVIVKEAVRSFRVRQDRCCGCSFPRNSWTTECASLHALLQEVDPTNSTEFCICACKC